MAGISQSHFQNIIQSAKGGVNTTAVGFLGIPRVCEVETLVKDLADKGPPQR